MSTWRHRVDRRCADRRERLQMAEALAAELSRAVSPPSPRGSDDELADEEHVGEVMPQ